MTVACNALTTRIVQRKLTLQLVATVRYNTKKVVAFSELALKAYDILKGQLHATITSRIDSYNKCNATQYNTTAGTASVTTVQP